MIAETPIPGARPMAPPRSFFARKGGGIGILRNALREKRPLILLLDYDGTLASIRVEASRAKLEQPVRALLGRLAESPRVRVGIVSGRSLEDLSEKVGLEDAFLAGNYGLQIRLGRRTWVHPQARTCPSVMARVSRDLAVALKGLHGVTVEDKGLTISIHFRSADPKASSGVEHVVGRVLGPFRGTLQSAAGKNVIEVLPITGWDKGRAVLRILLRLRSRACPLVIYAGDDRTDEDAFRALRPLGLAVRVGRKRDTEAEFYVQNRAGVIEILKIIEREIRPGIKRAETPSAP